MPGMAADMNMLFYGDNLDVLRQNVADESVDLVYLDPPFNSNRGYNVIFARRDTATPRRQPTRRFRRLTTLGAGRPLPKPSSLSTSQVAYPRGSVTP